MAQEYKKIYDSFRKADPTELYSTYKGHLERAQDPKLSDVQSRRIVDSVNNAFLNYIKTPEGQKKLHIASERLEQAEGQKALVLKGLEERAKLGSQVWVSMARDIKSIGSEYEELAQDLYYGKNVDVGVLHDAMGIGKMADEISKISAGYDIRIQRELKAGNAEKAESILSEKDAVLQEKLYHVRAKAIGVREGLEKGLESYIQKTSTGEILLSAVEIGTDVSTGGGKAAAKATTRYMAKFFSMARSYLKGQTRADAKSGLKEGGESMAKRTLAEARKPAIEGISLSPELKQQYEKSMESSVYVPVLSDVKSLAESVRQIGNAGERAKNTMSVMDRELNFHKALNAPNV